MMHGLYGMGDDATAYATAAGSCLSADESGYVPCPSGTPAGTVLPNVLGAVVPLSAPSTGMSTSSVAMIAVGIVLIALIANR